MVCVSTGRLPCRAQATRGMTWAPQHTQGARAARECAHRARPRGRAARRTSPRVHGWGVRVARRGRCPHTGAQAQRAPSLLERRGGARPDVGTCAKGQWGARGGPPRGGGGERGGTPPADWTAAAREALDYRSSKLRSRRSAHLLKGNFSCNSPLIGRCLPADGSEPIRKA